MRSVFANLVGLLSLPALCAHAAFIDYEFNQYEPKGKEEIHTLFLQEPLEGKKEERKTGVADKRVIIPRVKAVIVSGDSEIPPDHVLKTAGQDASRLVEFYRMPPGKKPVDRSPLKKSIEKEIIGQTLTFEKLERLKQLIKEFYAKQGQTLAMVSECHQKIAEDLIVIEVAESMVGKIEVLGNKWFSEDKLREYISLEEIRLSTRLISKMTLPS